MVTLWTGVPIPDDLWSAVVKIYLEAFPASERCDPDDLRASIESGRRTMRTIGTVDAFAITTDLVSAPPWIFGEYLAVRSDARSGGLGSRLLASLRDAGRPVVLEVEDPEWAGPVAERRIQFYERSGARRLPGSEGFLAPDLAVAGHYVAMWLLHLPAGVESEPNPAQPNPAQPNPAQPNPAQPNPALGAAMARTIWTEGYDLAENSPELAFLMSQLESSRQRN